EAGGPARIDKAFSWDAPLANHGLMQMLIRNCWAADPYPIDTLFMYMANMAWNSAMNTAETIRMLTDKDPATGAYRIPKIIYSDAYYSETVAYADLVLPDTTYLERWDYIALHERAPGVGPLAGWRGETGTDAGRGAPNPGQLDRYVANGCFWKYELPPEQLYYKHANKNYLETAMAMGFIGNADPIILQLYVEPLQRFRLAAQGHGPVVPPPDAAPRIEAYFDPLPFWYAPFEEELVDPHQFPLHAITQRPMQMYHSWP